MGKPRVLVIGGPTAGGKSALAIAVAKAAKGGGIIINADSLQIYQGLPVLTAQPDVTERKQTPHALFSTLSPDDACDAARWRDMALGEIDAAIAGKNIPVIVGGTGFYIDTLLRGISPIPEIPAQFRKQATDMQDEMGQEKFFALLAEKDPRTAEKIDRHNPQRCIRAMEVLLATGESIARWQDMPREGARPDLDFRAAVLSPPRDVLYARCDARFDTMIKNGALAEAAAFSVRISAGEMPRDVPPTRALGYAELAAAARGDITLEEARQQAQQATRNYAKRQVTWFRNQMPQALRLEKPDTEAVLAFAG